MSKKLYPETLIETITNISKTLSVDKNLNNKNSGIHTGSAGIALFFHHLNQIIPNESNHDNCLRHIEKCVDAIENQQLGYTFCSGIAGIAWGLEYFSDKGLFEVEEEDFLSELDIHIFNHATNDIENNNVDFLHGGIGAIAYFLNRLPNIYAEDCLIKFVNLLWEKAEKGTNEIKWKNSFNQELSEPGIIREYNLGLSHGIPSLIIILIKIYNKNIAATKCKKLIMGSIEWILNQKLPESYDSIFPNSVGSTIEKHSSRLAWCYGDLGVSSSIWQAGQALNREDWKQEALNILLHSSKRRDLKENSVVDAALCHGTAGIAHIFNRFYKETGIKEFDDARWYWLEQTLKMAKWEDGLAGYKVWQAERGWQNEDGLLEGVAGIGLTLLGFLTNDVNDLSWDSCLLLS